ncbi:MAG TPA: penicillin-binding protein 1C [Alphaproteobacteria bacterium]|nr:penicillin-binding protein 1C [Alphaproteobacteria bacterium]
MLAVRRAVRWASGILGAVLVLAGSLYALDRIFPPRLERYEAASTVVLDERGAILRAFTTPDDAWRMHANPIDVDPLYLTLLEAYEDKRFAHHWGVDPLALLRATGQMIGSGRIISGGSTLTMQAARLLEPHRRTIGGKLFEIVRALQLEWHYSKAEILSFYLTLAPFGGNLEGVRAASLAYFGKEPRHLAPGEAALLVSLPQSPEHSRPDLHPETARQARDKVLGMVAARGALSRTALADAKQEAMPSRRASMPFSAPHLAFEFASKASQGSTIRTTLDGQLQARIEALVRRESLEKEASAAILVVENSGRRVRAYLGSADFNSAAGQIDLVRAKRSPGSTLKPFIYGMGFDALLCHPDTIVEDAPLRIGDYAPQNFDREYHGAVTVRTALQRSLNIPAVALLERLGPQRFVTSLRGAGAELVFDQNDPSPSLAVALGGVGISLSDLVMLYASLADGGRVSPLVLQPGGPAPSPVPLLTPASAWYVSDILRGVPPPSPFAQLPSGVATRPIAFKTGTSYGFRDAWAIGYSDRYTVGVWVGRPDGAPRPGKYGIGTAAPLLFKVFGLLPVEAFAAASPPRGLLKVRSPAALPIALRRLSPAGASANLGGATSPSPLRILFPPQDAILELTEEKGRFAPIPLKAAGGEPPLRWVADGKPVAADAASEDFGLFRPDGPGFSSLTVIDASGKTVTETVRLRLSE